MDGLWAIVDSLSIKNKKWLSDKLNRSLYHSETIEEKEILKGISRSLSEAKNGKTLPLDTIWDQL